MTDRPAATGTVFRGRRRSRSRPCRLGIARTHAVKGWDCDSRARDPVSAPRRRSRVRVGLRAGPPLISCQPGFRNLSLSRSKESPKLYLLLVEWDSIEAHTDGFRTSNEYQDWKRLLHHFYEPFPTVEHFTAIP